MQYFIRGGEAFIDGRFLPKNISISDGRLRLTDEDLSADAENVIDASGKRVIPGFIDIHTHGAVGIDVNAARADDFRRLSEFFASRGCTAWLCSILTDTKEQTLRVIEEFKKYKEGTTSGAELMGVHLEGPFLSKEYKGAMPEQLLQESDLTLLKEYQAAAQGMIKYITISPELNGLVDRIPEITDMGIVVAMGHSGADYETAMRAIRSGVCSCTHIFNAMRFFHHHEPGIMGAALESDIYTEAICDGRHLHPGTVRMLFKAKTPKRVIAITDSIMAAGLPDGNYKLGVNDVVVKNGDARLAISDVRAGSTLTIDDAFYNILKFTGRTVQEIVYALTENPARLIGVDDRKGFIRDGYDADLIIIDENNRINKVFTKGVAAF